MEWIKDMCLKKALFTLTLINLSAAAVLSVFSFLGCMKLNSTIAPIGFKINVDLNTVTKTEYPAPSSGTAAAANLLSILQIILPILFFVAALFLTASLFYHWKLKKPLEILMDGANRIMKNDLDFTIAASSGDELGHLCVAFETMRQSLLRDNRELWRQMEERKRLNAAFSHDLRNPVTVLKGSAKMAKQCAAVEKANTSQLMENLIRIETYTDRIERYVETMSNVQRLEQVQLQKLTIDTCELIEELNQALFFAAQDSQKQLVFHSTMDTDSVLLDKNMLLQITENLVSNALRFAKQTISVMLSAQADTLKLEVTDDGSGFPAELLKRGVQPFQKGAEEIEHFGMGLYICNLLCQKHGGTLKIGNSVSGAVVCAILKIS